MTGRRNAAYTAQYRLADIFGFPGLKYYPLPDIFQKSCFLTLSPAHSFQNKDGQFVNVNQAQVSSQQKKVACAAVKQ
jgi:hypothetical protein